MPFAMSESASSWSRAGSNTVRGCNGLGSIRSMETTLAGAPSGAGTSSGSTAVGRAGSSAERPLPNALRGLSGALFMSQDLLCKLYVALGAAGAKVVGEDRFAETGGLREPDAARDYGLKYVLIEELAKVICDL